MSLVQYVQSAVMVQNGINGNQAATNNEQQEFTNNQIAMNHARSTEMKIIQDEFKEMQKNASEHLPILYNRITGLEQLHNECMINLGMGVAWAASVIALAALYELCIARPRQNKHAQKLIKKEIALYEDTFHTVLPQCVRSLDKERIVVDNSNSVNAAQVSLIVQFEQKKQKMLSSIENLLKRLDAMYDNQDTQEDIKPQIADLKTIARNFEQKIEAMPFHTE